MVNMVIWTIAGTIYFLSYENERRLTFVLTFDLYTL